MSKPRENHQIMLAEKTLFKQMYNQLKQHGSEGQLNLKHSCADQQQNISEFRFAFNWSG